MVYCKAAYTVLQLQISPTRIVKMLSSTQMMHDWHIGATGGCTHHLYIQEVLSRVARRWLQHDGACWIRPVAREGTLLKAVQHCLAYRQQMASNALYQSSAALHHMVKACKHHPDALSRSKVSPDRRAASTATEGTSCCEACEGATRQQGDTTLCLVWRTDELGNKEHGKQCIRDLSFFAC